MAKRRRARSRPVKRKPSKPASRVRRVSVRPRSAGPVAAAPAGAPAPGPPAPRPTYIEAVSLYERGLQALQRREYVEAGTLLRAVLSSYPEEKELHERVRLYINVCERQSAPREAAPRNAGESVYAATLAINAGKFDTAVEHLRAVTAEDPANDHVCYMLAVAHALRGDLDDAVRHLLRAIELNPENRAIARQDRDLENLRLQEAFRAATDPVSIPRPDRRRQPRVRGPR
jgi:tetratricopeptide (TPR) repeat protein